MLNPEVPVHYPPTLYSQKAQGNVTCCASSLTRRDSASRVHARRAILRATSVRLGGDRWCRRSAIHPGSTARRAGRGIRAVSDVLPASARHRQCRGTACCDTAATPASRRGCAPSTPTARGGNMARRGTDRRSARNGSRSTATKRGTRPVTPRPPKPPTSGKSTTAAAAMKIEDHPRHRRPYESVLETIGWTPLIRLHHVTRGIRTPVYGKAEFFNPGGSVKDRIGLPIIERAEREGRSSRAARSSRARAATPGVGLAHRRGAQGLQVHLHDARQDVAGESSAPQGVWRAGHRDADGSAAGPSGQLRRDGAPDRSRRRRTPSSRTSSTTRPIPTHTTRPRGPSCGSRPRDVSPISSRRRGPVARSPEWVGISRSTILRSA